MASHHDPEWYWRGDGVVFSPDTNCANRLGGAGALKAIEALLELHPQNSYHKRKITFMAKRGGKWGEKMKALLE